MKRMFLLLLSIIKKKKNANLFIINNVFEYISLFLIYLFLHIKNSLYHVIMIVLCDKRNFLNKEKTRKKFPRTHNFYVLFNTLVLIICVLLTDKILLFLLPPKFLQLVLNNYIGEILEVTKIKYRFQLMLLPLTLVLPLLFAS